MLLLDLAGSGDSLASRLRHRMADVAVSDARWLPLLPGAGSPHLEDSLVPSADAVGRIDFPAWQVQRNSSPAWRHMGNELLRLGFDPGMLEGTSPRSSRDAACVIAGSLLWLSAHATMVARPYSPPGLEVVAWDAAGEALGHLDVYSPEPARFHDAATMLGPSATSSLAAIIARACGEPVAPADEDRASYGASVRAMRHIRPAMRWVELAFLYAIDPYRSLGPEKRAEAIGGVLLPAIRADFSYDVSPHSAAARARDMFCERSLWI